MTLNVFTQITRYFRIFYSKTFKKRKHYKCRNPLKTRYKRCIAPNKSYQENEQKLKNISFIFCQTFLVVARRLVVLLQYRTIVQHRLLFFLLASCIPIIKQKNLLLLRLKNWVAYLLWIIASMKLVDWSNNTPVIIWENINLPLYRKAGDHNSEVALKWNSDVAFFTSRRRK